MQIKTDIREKTAHISIEGMLDTLASETFQREVASLRDAAVQDIEVDFSATSYICSSALRVLLQAKQIAALAGGEVRIKSPSTFVLDVLKTVGFVAVFKIV